MCACVLLFYVCVFVCLQRDLELIAEALRIPGNKSLGPVARVRHTGRKQGGWWWGGGEEEGKGEGIIVRSCSASYVCVCVCAQPDCMSVCMLSHTDMLLSSLPPQRCWYCLAVLLSCCCLFMFMFMFVYVDRLCAAHRVCWQRRRTTSLQTLHQTRR